MRRHRGQIDLHNIQHENIDDDDLGDDFGDNDEVHSDQIAAVTKCNDEMSMKHFSHLHGRGLP
jgi:hypothetical protein